MGVGQRALFVWILLLLTLIFLVIYLDGGLDREPFVFFILLWMLDACFFGMTIWRCAQYYNLCGANEDAAFVSEMPKMNVRQAGYAVALVLSKMAFEIVLCIQLKFRVFNIVWVLTPLWVFLALVAFQLSAKILRMHLKAV